MSDSNRSGMDRRGFLGSLTFAAGASGLLGATASRAAAPGQAAPPPSQVPAPAAMILPQKAPLAEVDGKTAYVTGASSGIGLGIARACYDAGMKVIIGYIDDSQIEEALALFADQSRVHAIRHDVTDRPGWVRLADEAERRFGRVHLLVNNAGVGVRAMLSTSSFNDYDWGMAVNTTGVFNGIATFVPRMKAYGEGAHIVTTCSMSGILPGASLGVYTTSKFATCGMMEALRVELQNTNIGTSVYLPGGVNTNIRLSERYRQEQFRNAPAGAAAPPLPLRLHPCLRTRQQAPRPHPLRHPRAWTRSKPDKACCWACVATISSFSRIRNSRRGCASDSTPCWLRFRWVARCHRKDSPSSASRCACRYMPQKRRGCRRIPSGPCGRADTRAAEPGAAQSPAGVASEVDTGRTALSADFAPPRNTLRRRSL